MATIEHTGRERIESAIRQCAVCFVGMADTDGTPYVIPMNFGYRDNILYLHSAKEGRSISILERNPQVCVAFSAGHELVCQHPDVACSYSMHSDSVLAEGKVVFEEEPDKKVEALNIIMQHYSGRTFTYGAPAVANVCIWKIHVERMTCKEFGVRPAR